jgi:Ca-activated chloride channel family protein
MALDQSWMLIICVGTAIAIISIIVFLIKRKEDKLNNKVMFSNLKRLTNIPEYAALLKEYRLGIIGIVSMLIASILLVSVIAAKPVNVEAYTPTKYNRDIVLCLDASGSMYEVDVQVLKKFQELIKGFKGERVALVIWNSTSNLVFPLTDDYEYINKQLQYVSDGFTIDPITGESKGYDFMKYTVNGEGGSLIGDGLTACSLTFDKEDTSEKRSKSIILATDNVVNGEQIIDLPTAVNYASENNITVYGIRPTTGYEVGGEEEEMKSTLEAAKGKFYPLDDPNATSEIVNKISAEEAGAIKGETVITKTDVPNPWIIGFIITLMLSLGLMWRYKV